MAVKLTDINLNPQPAHWPECKECRTPFVLRRAFVMSRKPDGKTTIGPEWVWQRDCKHKKAEAVTGSVVIAAKRRARFNEINNPKRRSSRAKRSSLSPAEKKQRDGTWKGHRE